MAAPKIIPCVLKQLPADLHVAAARAAIEINPANRPPAAALSTLVLSAFVAGPGVGPMARIAVLTGKYWGTKGVDLGVAFLDGGSADLRARILSHMNAWGQWANVRFREASSAMAEVRITRTRGEGYYSYLGTDVLQIPKSEPTMNLEAFSTSTPESEYRRVVRHETGHTLGAPHEHSRAEIVNRLDPNKVIAYFEATQGWTADEIRQQILTPIPELSLTGATPHAEEDSVMTYSFPGSLTKDGRAIVGGKDITADDGTFMGRLYPKAVTPPSPPPGPPPAGGSEGKVLIQVDTAAGTFAFNYEGRQCNGRFNDDATKTIAGTWSNP